MAGSPRNVSATDGTYWDKVIITWDHPEGDLPDIYLVTRDGMEPGTVLPMGPLTYTDTTMVVDTVYTYTVTARFGGDEYSANDTGYAEYPVTPPPASVVASKGTYTDKVRMTIALDDPLPTEVNIYRDGGWMTAIVPLISPLVYDDATGNAGQTYSYGATCGIDYGGHIEVSALVSDNGYKDLFVNPVQNLSASDGTYTDKCILTWDLPVGGAPNWYRIYRDATLVETIAGSVLGVDITSYEDYTGTPGTVYSHGIVAVIGDPSTGFTSVRVNDNGYIAPRNPAQNFAASDGTFDDRVRLTWELPTGNLQVGFNLSRDGVLLGLLGAAITSYDDLTAVAGVLYTYSIVAVHLGGDSVSVSDTGYVQSEIPPVPPTPPTPPVPPTPTIQTGGYTMAGCVDTNDKFLFWNIPSSSNN